jgi:hypothetical protein
MTYSNTPTTQPREQPQKTTAFFRSLFSRAINNPGPKALPRCRRPEWRRSRNDQIAFFYATT